MSDSDDSPFSGESEVRPVPESAESFARFCKGLASVELSGTSD